MKILEEYADDRSALEAAINFIESDPPLRAVELDVLQFGPVLVRLFKEALEEIDASERPGGIPLDGDDLHAEVVCLARDVLGVAYEAQEARDEAVATD